MSKLTSSIGLMLALEMFLVAQTGTAESRGIEETELVEETQNLVANLVSISFQNSMNFVLEDNHRAQNILNIQPVIPLNLNKNWNS